ncbi:MAG: hypothetical protein HY717_01340 [Planctomycetes bacterium]|nr:hypothetical protein [Planctomycetota bacterium]
MKPPLRGIDPAAWIFILLGAAAGCAQSPARIHPRFQEIAPNPIRVAPVENQTWKENLDQYSTAGLLQRAILGPGTVNVLEEFRRGAQEALEKRGYALLETAPEGAGAKPAAELRIRILSWDRIPAFEGAGIEGRFEVELIRLEAQESLYFRNGHLSAASRNPSGVGVTPLDLERSIRSAVGRALGELPAFPPGVKR